jgi:hypothetical protein
LIANCPVPLGAGAAQIKTFQHDRSPTVHHVEAGQFASPTGAWLHGAENQLWLEGESVGALGGQAEIEQGVEPN